MQELPAITFATRVPDPPALELRVNFGIFAGRAATPAEIDDLAKWLIPEVGEVSIISEERHEIDGDTEGSVHQVRIEVAADRLPADEAELDDLEARLIERADHWARQCIAERHSEISEL